MITLKEGETIDADTLEVIPAPAKEEKPVEDKKTDEPEEGEKEPASDEEEEEEAKETEKKEEESADESADESEANQEKETETEEEKPAGDDEAIGIDDFIKNEYEEKWGIKSKQELDENLQHLEGVLDLNNDLMKENEELKAKIKEGADKPVFKSEAQESLFNFLKDYDPGKYHSGIQTWARLVGMDIEKEPSRLHLEEQFVLENPDLSREDAQRKFARDFNRKYGEPNRDDYDSDADYKEEKEMREIDMKSDASKAKKYLLEKQKEFKKEPPKTEDNKQEENPEIKSAIRSMGTELDSYMKPFTEIVFTPEDGKTGDYKFVLTKEQKAAVHAAMKSWIENPTAYDEKGKFDGDLNEKVIGAAFALFGPEMVDVAYRAGQRKGEIKKADQLGKVKPNRVAKSADSGMGNDLSEDKQIEMLIKKKKAQGNNKAPVYK